MGKSTDRHQSCAVLGRLSSVLWLFGDDSTGRKMEENLKTTGAETGKTNRSSAGLGLQTEMQSYFIGS